MFVNNEEMAKGTVGAQLRCANASPGKAGLLLATCLLYLATAPAALADNECELVGVDPSLNGPLADSYDCADASYADGVTYTADGDLTVNFTNAGSPARSTIGTAVGDLHGIELTATGSDSIFFDSATTGTELQNLNGMEGAVLSVTTANGNIDIDTEEIDGDTFSASGVTHGILAESTGTGSIDIATTGNVDVQSGANPAGSIGIEALTNSGDISLTTGGTVIGNQGAIRAVSGNGDISIETNGSLGGSAIEAQYGIQAATGGSGTLTITAANDVHVGNGSDGIAIDATTGTGDLIIDIVSTGSSDAITGGDVGIRTNTGGDVLIDVADERNVSAFGGIAMDLTAAGETTVNNNGGSIRGGSGVGEFAIRAAGDSLVLNNTDGPVDSSFDGIRGALDFSGLTDGYTFTNNGTWNIRQGVARLGASSANRQVVSTLGAGTFINAGTIEFGELEEVILAPGTAFTGAGDSLFHMRVSLNGIAQSSCDAATVAGCLDLSGGSTSGQTSILITSVAPPLDPAAGLTIAANAGILLVDVNGGTSAAEHFVLHPDSENYLDTSFYGPVITTGDGPLVYTLLYNPNTQQHILSSVPTDEGVTYAAFNQEVLSMWHTTADAVAGRQADLREGAARGGWIRVVNDSSERDSTLSMTTHGNTFTYDQDYELDTNAAIVGMDVHSGENHIIGLHAGFVSSHLKFDASSNRDRAKGAAVGTYGSWWRDLGPGQIVLDGTLNANFLRLKHKNSFEVTDSDVRTLGIRAEAGWLFPLGDMFYVQPLVTAAYVRADIEALRLRQNKLHFEETNSERAALGVRLGGDVDLTGNRFSRLRYWLTARAWEEYAEDGSVDYQTSGEPLSIKDDISETFEEVGLGASLTNADDTLSVFLSGNLQSGDQTDSTNVTIGARMRW